MPRTREQDAVYQRERRARQRAASAAPMTGEHADGSAFGVPVAAFAAPPAGDPDAVALTVKLSDAQFAKLAALARAHHGSSVRLDDALRLAVEVAHRAIVANGTAA